MAGLLNFVELDRRFGVLDGTAPVETAAQQNDFVSMARRGESLSWKAVLKEKLVVILGEPGSGKSWELRHRANELSRQGEITFFVELEQLISRSLPQVLGPEDRPRFQNWLRGRHSAYFLLDSVDEAKIRRSVDFHVALDAIRNAIGESALHRACFVISSRISEWQPETDRVELLARLTPRSQPSKAATDSSDRTEPQVLVVQLNPLDRDQIHKFVASRRSDIADQFMAAIDESHAWEFARRPADVNDLVEFWERHGRLGTLTEIIDEDVTNKLRETTLRQRECALSESDARKGAEVLAAATIFCQEIQFKVPDDSSINSGALDAARCLPPDWTSGQCSALLTRPLFDSATYGKIRFHHRRVGEYLAAEWLRKLIAAGCPTTVLLDLLFEVDDTKTIVRRNLIPVIAWLCIGDQRWNQEVRERVLASAPEMHFEYGDAGSLPLEYRRAVLEAWVKRNEGRKHVWVQSSAEAMKRLAAPELASHVANLLINSETSSDVRIELVGIVQHGKLKDCIPTLISLFPSVDLGDDLQIYILAALRDIGTDESLDHVWSILRTHQVLPDRITGIASAALYPRVIGPSELVEFLGRTRVTTSRSHQLSWVLEEHLKEHMPAAHREELLSGLNQLVQRPPHILHSGKETRISGQFIWGLNLMPMIVLRLLEGTTTSESDAAATSKAISLLSESRHFPDLHVRGFENIGPATKRHSRVRRSIFWEAVDAWRREGAIGRPWVMQLSDDHNLLSVDDTDLNWLIEEIQHTLKTGDLKLCFDIAIQLGAARTRHGRRALRSVIGTRLELSKLFAEALSEQRWRPLRYIWWLCTARHLWSSRRFKLERWRISLTDSLLAKWRLCRGRSLLRSGAAIGWLAELSREAGRSGMKFSATDWAALAKRRGQATAKAVKVGCKKCFRTFGPPLLPHEEPEPGRIAASVIVGLVGVQALVDDRELAFHSMTADEVRLATRYAAREMNGFPAWLPELGKVQSKFVCEVLEQCVEGEWSYAPDREQTFDVLAELASEGGNLARLVRARVINLLQKGAPPNLRILKHALAIVLRTSTNTDNEIAALCRMRLRSEPSASSESFVLWVSMCLQFDAAEAIRVLEEKSAETDMSPTILRICCVLGRDGRQQLPIISDPDYLRPQILRKWIPLVFRNVHPNMDIDRRGAGPFTPTAGDQAREFRNGLLTRLSRNGEKDAPRVLRELRDLPELSTQTDWITHLIKERAERDAEHPAWQPSDLRDFAREFETDPRNAGELFRLAANRIAELKYEVERSDISLREEVQYNCDEYQLRRWIAKKLRERSRQRYTVPQEEEIDLKQRPDVRVENPKTDPVSIEIKWAENWSVAELIERLETQLIGQYLRAHNSRHGIYLLGVDGRKKLNWRHEGRSITFLGVLALLHDRVKELRATSTQFDDVRVIGIDFRNPPELG